jgi:hypothetical protein
MAREVSAKAGTMEKERRSPNRSQLGERRKARGNKGCLRNLLTPSPPLHQGCSLAASTYSAPTPMLQEDTP